MEKLLIYSALFLTIVACAEDKEARRMSYSQYITLISPEHAPEDKDYLASQNSLADFQKQNSLSFHIQRAPRNPNCCFWVELWRQDRAAYLLRIAPTGLHLTAGGPEAVKSALDFINSVRKNSEDGNSTFPIGIYSNAKFHTIMPDTVFNAEGNPTAIWPNKWPVHMLDPAQRDTLTVEMTPVLNDFAKEFGFAPVKHAGVNPENCLWLEHWAYSPNSWVVRISDSAPGAHITAGSTAKLQEALAFIRKNAKKSEQGWVLPVGNFTNLTVQDTGKGPPK